jgi:hypothetical protein
MLLKKMRIVQSKHLPNLLSAFLTLGIGATAGAHNFYAGGTVTSITNWSTGKCDTRCNGYIAGRPRCSDCSGSSLDIVSKVAARQRDTASGSSQQNFSGGIGGEASFTWRELVDGKFTGNAGWTGSWSSQWTRENEETAEDKVEVHLPANSKKCGVWVSRTITERKLTNEKIRSHSTENTDKHCDWNDTVTPARCVFALTGHNNIATRTETDFVQQKGSIVEYTCSWAANCAPGSAALRAKQVSVRLATYPSTEKSLAPPCSNWGNWFTCGAH